ncbi:MAG: class I SAM-dependent methyltransferase [Asgard group archaeon]|nr:class I SAM-dependent methyltransferase [Asgard group archaeon]
MENDRKFTQQADEYSANYEKMLKLMGLFVMMWEPRQRKKFLQGLDIAKGSKILDICTGPGNNLKELHKQIGKEGLLVAIDLSEKMVEKCQKKHATLPVSIHRGNALALPYKDNFFDVVITSGGLNTFGDKKKGITEMMRVGKKGALIVIVDEGMKPTKRETWIGKRLIKMNSLYKTKPPLKLLPDEVDPKIGYIYRDTFYTLQFENP